MANIMATARAHPAANTAHNTNRAASASTCHTTAGIGRHCQNSSASTAVAARTKVDRST